MYRSDLQWIKVICIVHFLDTYFRLLKTYAVWKITVLLVPLLNQIEFLLLIFKVTFGLFVFQMLCYLIHYSGVVKIFIFQFIAIGKSFKHIFISSLQALPTFIGHIQIAGLIENHHFVNALPIREQLSLVLDWVYLLWQRHKLKIIWYKLRFRLLMSKCNLLRKHMPFTMITATFFLFIYWFVIFAFFWCNNSTLCWKKNGWTVKVEFFTAIYHLFQIHSGCKESAVIERLRLWRSYLCWNYMVFVFLFVWGLRSSLQLAAIWFAFEVDQVEHLWHFKQLLKIKWCSPFIFLIQIFETFNLLYIWFLNCLHFFYFILQVILYFFSINWA